MKSTLIFFMKKHVQGKHKAYKQFKKKTEHCDVTAYTFGLRKVRIVKPTFFSKIRFFLLFYMLKERDRENFYFWDQCVQKYINITKYNLKQ